MKGLRLLSLLFFVNCSIVFYRSMAVNSENFDYSKVSEAHFGYNNEKPIPLTVRRGNNIFGRTTKDGRYLFFAGEDGGTFNILFRDLKTAVVVPVTKHPSNDTKPSVHPSGKKIAFVTERFDSEGDIAILEIDPQEWLEKYLQGERLALSEKLVVPTNPNYFNPTQIQRFVDTDPTWSPDGRYILFATDRFSRGKTNLALIDTKDNFKIIQITTDGGASPCFAPNGKEVFYISYKDHKNGEIYKLNLETKEEIRITFDEYIDLSPSVSDDGKYLIYTSIRKDTNENNQLGLRDNSYIIRIDLQTNKRIVLTDGGLSIFDTNYSSFNNGSIIFTASLYNSLNVYFIPIDGEIPKQKDIQSHYEFVKLYGDRSIAFHELAFNSLEWFYGNDPLYPLIYTRSLRQLAKEYHSEGKSKKAHEIYQQMLSYKYHPNLGFAYALAFYELNKSKKKDLTPEIWKYFEEMKNLPNVHPQIPPAILYWIGRIYFEQKQYNKTLEVYEKLLQEYPNFYEIDDVKYYQGNLLYEKDIKKIPKPYIELLKQNQENGEIIHKIFEDIHSDFLEITEPVKRIDYLQTLLDSQKEIQEIPKLKSLFRYAIAEALAELDDFEKSNQILHEIKKEVPFGSYMFLKASLLLVNNYEKVNDIFKSEDEMYEFISAYSPFSGFRFSPRELEETFINLETQAKVLEAQREYKKAILVYFKINEILNKAIERKLPLGSIWNKYKNYYHKKLVDLGFAYSDFVRYEKEKSLFTKLNVVKQTDPFGTLTEGLALFFKGSWFRIFGDFRDLQILNPIEQEGVQDLEKYYTENLNKAKSILDLGFVYGYAYFLIRKATQEEAFYLEENALTERRKKEILRQLRSAELELLWCIYAKPDFVDAYLLLGWLYQYIDIRKENIIFPEFEKDRNIFHTFYLKSFPRKYLEENIDVYTHALEVTQGSLETKSELALHLNLGNNYFLLNNYQKALIHYEKVNKLTEKILEHTLFETYVQEALFYLNYSRALIYNSKVADAVPYLLRVKEIYYEKEYFPLVSKISGDQKKFFEERFETVKQKLALIHALLGLVYLEIEKFNKAILSLETAISLNSDREYINNISLFNTIAICYQKIGEYSKSEKYLNLAHTEYKRRIRLIDAFDFSLWNLIYTDDIRVIGEGRFVGEFPLDFSNLLTQSIQIQNRLQLKEFDNAKELIQARRKFIHKKNLEKYVMGQKLLDLTLDDLGFTEFARGNFIKAEEYYETNYKILEKAKKDKEAFASFYRGSIALFSSIEQDSLKISNLKERLLENLNFLNKVYENELKQCLSTRENNQKNYLFCKKDFYKNYVDFDPLLAYTYFYLGEISFSLEEFENAFEYYGKSLGLFQTPMEIPISEIGLAEDPFTKKERTRFALAQAIIYFRLGDLEKYKKVIQDAFNLAVEFELEKEFILVQLIQAEIDFLLAQRERDYRTILEKLEKIEFKLRNSVGLFYELEENVLNYIYSLKSYCYVHLRNKEELRKTREKLFSAIFFKQLLTNEFQFQDIEIFRSLNKIQFLISEDREYSLRIENALQKGQNPKEILKSKENNYKKILQTIFELKKKFPKGSDAFSWLENPTIKKAKFSSDEVVLEIYNSQTEILLIATSHNKEEIFSCNIKNLIQTLSNIIEDLVLKNSNVKRIVFIPSAYLYNIPFHQIPFKQGILSENFEIRFLFRLSQLEREQETGYSRLRRITTIDTREERKKALLENILINPIEILIPPAFIEEEKLKELNLRIVSSEKLLPYLLDTDVLEGPTDFSNRKQLIGEDKKGYINLKQIVENQWNIPVLVLNNYSKSMENFLKIGFLYDILQFAGVQSIVLIDSNRQDSERVRNSIISNISSGNRIIQEEKLMLVGESLNPYPQNFNFIQEFEKFTKIGIAYERLASKDKTQYLNAMKSFLQANSVLSSEQAKLQIFSEINIARAKTKLFPNTSEPLQYFRELLEKVKEGELKEAKILFHALLTCYSETLNVSCEDLYKRFNKNKHTTSERRKIVEFFRNLDFGNLNELSNFSISKDQELDEFIFNLEIALLYEKNLEFELALKYLEKNENLTKNQEELQVINHFKTEIEFEKFFVEGIDTGNLLEQENLYSLGKSKKWDKYKTKLGRELENEREHFKKDYLERIYSAFEKIPNSSYFQPSSLSPIFLKENETSLKLISNRDRSFLFYLFLISSFYNPKTEVNPQINLLLDTEIKLGNKNRYLWMLLKWAETLYFHGFFESSWKYFEIFEKNLSNLYEHLEDDYLLLKYELSLIYPQIKMKKEEKERVNKFAPDVFENYEQISKITNVEQITKTLQKFIQNYKNKNEKIDFYKEKKISNFLNLCMYFAKERKAAEVFFELGVFKEKWKAYNERIFGRDLSSSEIPNITLGLAKAIQNKISNQRFLSLFDLGNETYLVNIEKDQFSLEMVFSENENIKQEILDYVLKIQNGGTHFDKAKKIEFEYRKILNLKQNQITYLYFPSYHFKAPLEFSELENVFYTTNLDILIETKPFSISSKTPNYKVILYKEKNSPEWWQSLKKLEELEVSSEKKSTMNLFHLSQEQLVFKDGKNLTFNNKNLYEISFNRVGEFGITGNLLKDSSLKNDDVFHSLYFLAKAHHGFGFVEIFNAKDTHTAYFIKNFFSKTNENLNFQERFYEAYSLTKKELKEDRFYVGWKAITNVFLKE